MSYLYGKPGPSEAPGPAPEGMRWRPKMSGGYWEEIEERTSVYTYYERTDGTPTGDRWFFRRSPEDRVEFWIPERQEWFVSAHSAGSHSPGFAGRPFDEDGFLILHAPVDASELPEEALA